MNGFGREDLTLEAHGLRMTEKSEAVRERKDIREREGEME
jgi:hypothetical protein